MGEQLRLDDASAKWSEVLARLRGSVTSLGRQTSAGWVWSLSSESASPGGEPRQGGPYRSRTYRRGKDTLDLWYATGDAPLSHELVAATCGGVAQVLGCDPDVVIRFVYEGQVG